MKNVIDTLKKIVGCEPDMKAMENAFEDHLYNAQMKIWFGGFYDHIKNLDDETRAYLVSAYLQKKISIHNSSIHATVMSLNDYGTIVFDTKTNRFYAYREADNTKEYFVNFDIALDYLFMKV